MVLPAAELELELLELLAVELLDVVGTELELELEQAARVVPSTARADTATIRVE
jgi:hypothetical protein